MQDTSTSVAVEGNKISHSIDRALAALATATLAALAATLPQDFKSQKISWPIVLGNSVQLFLLGIYVRGKESRSVTRWLDYFSLFCFLQQLKFAPQKCQSRFKICQTINNPSKVCLRFLSLPKCKILPNLVTLVSRFLHKMAQLRFF